MKKVGFVGLGDMGLSMSANLIKSGFELAGYDLRGDRLVMLSKLGGKPAKNCQEIVENSAAVFIMVLNGTQVKEVVVGEEGLLEGLRTNSTIIVSATINPSEIRQIAPPVSEKSINLLLIYPSVMANLVQRTEQSH